MGLRRRQDWPQRLLDAIEEKESVRFSPGTHDCCISACDIIERMTGTDIAAHIRGYRGKKEMHEVLEEHGGVESIVDKTMRDHGCGEIPVACAGRGDKVMLDMPDGHTLGVVDLDGINAIACGKRGFERVPIKDHATRAWRIG